MKNHIAEDLPARKFAPAAAGSAAPVDRNDKKENSGKTPEERAKQAVYDIRYKARRDEIPLIKAYTEYMKNSSISGQERSMVKAKLFGKVSGGMRAEDFNPIFKNAASDNVAKALFKVFVEEEKQEHESISLSYLEEFDNPENRKYKVRVTDKNTKRSYVRMATREKINQLRANPNIESVEMTEYGEPYEGERKKGSQTAKVAAGGGLDYDGDGKVESGAKEYRGAVHNAIQRKKGGVADGKDTSSVREDFIHEAGAKKKSKKKRSDRLDVMPPGQTNTVNMSPTQGGNERVGLMAHNELEGELIAETGYSKFLKKVKEEMECGSDDKKKKNEVDNRSLATKINIAKNIVRAATGIKNPMVMVASEQAGPALPGEKRPGSPKAPGNRPHLPGEKPTPPPNQSKLQMASYEPEGEVLEDYMRINSDGSRERVAGDPPKAKLKRKPLGHTPEQKRQMNKQPKTDYRARPGESD